MLTTRPTRDPVQAYVTRGLARLYVFAREMDRGDNYTGVFDSFLTDQIGHALYAAQRRGMPDTYPIPNPARRPFYRPLARLARVEESVMGVPITATRLHLDVLAALACSAPARVLQQQMTQMTGLAPQRLHHVISAIRVVLKNQGNILEIPTSRPGQRGWLLQKVES